MTKADEAREELWNASVRAYHASRGEEMRAEWRAYHEGQAARHRATLQALASYHEAEAAKLQVDEPIKESA